MYAKSHKALSGIKEERTNEPVNVWLVCSNGLSVWEFDCCSSQLKRLGMGILLILTEEN